MSFVMYCEVTNMDEVWRDVVQYPDLYEVSNLGRVRSKDRIVSRARSDGRPYTQYCKGKLLTPHMVGILISSTYTLLMHFCSTGICV